MLSADIVQVFVKCAICIYHINYLSGTALRYDEMIYVYVPSRGLALLEDR